MSIRTQVKSYKSRYPFRFDSVTKMGCFGCASRLSMINRMVGAWSMHRIETAAARFVKYLHGCLSNYNQIHTKQSVGDSHSYASWNKKIRPGVSVKQAPKHAGFLGACRPVPQAAWWPWAGLKSCYSCRIYADNNWSSRNEPLSL